MQTIPPSFQRKGARGMLHHPRWAFREPPLRWIPASAGMTNCYPLGIKGEGWDHSPSFASFKHHSHHGSKALPLDSGFRRNDGRHPASPLARSEGGLLAPPCVPPQRGGGKWVAFAKGESPLQRHALDFR